MSGFYRGGVGSTIEIGEIAGAVLVTEAEGISSNDNDTTIPSSAAVKDYADSAGSPSPFDATVASSGGDYTTVAAAFAGGARSIVITSSVTESSNITFSADTYIYIQKGVTWTHGAQTHTLSASVNLTIKGENKDTSEIDWTATGAQILFDGDSTNEVIIDTLYLDNNSSAGSTQFSDAIFIAKDIKLDVPNVASAGLKNLSSDATYNNIHLNGAGTSTSLAIEPAIYTKLSNLHFEGTWSTTATAVTAVAGLLYNNVIMEVGNDMFLAFGNSAALNTFLADSNNPTLSIQGTGVAIQNGYLNNGMIDFTDKDQAVINNVTYVHLDLSDSGATNALISNSIITAVVTIAGDNHKCTNVDFIGGASVSSGGNDNGFLNCQFGVNAGGGALTLTINSGANRTRVVGCMTDAAISDSGTSSELGFNTVY